MVGGVLAGTNHNILKGRTGTNMEFDLDELQPIKTVNGSEDGLVHFKNSRDPLCTAPEGSESTLTIGDEPDEPDLQPGQRYDFYLGLVVSPGSRRSDDSDCAHRCEDEGEGLRYWHIEPSKVGRFRLTVADAPSAPRNLKAGVVDDQGTFVEADADTFVRGDGTVVLRWDAAAASPEVERYEYRFRREVFPVPAYGDWVLAGLRRGEVDCD